MNKKIDTLENNYFRSWYIKNHEREKEKRREYSLKQSRENPISRMFQGAKQRAKDKGLEFSISKQDIFIPSICPILKVPFRFGTEYAASLDRINPKQGYIKGNVWVISRKANLMKNNATSQELKEFAHWVINQSKPS